jgi:hypothetical protein
MIFQTITNLFKIAETYKEDINEVNAEEMDDSTEIPIVIVSASSALENVQWFLLQQEDT